VGGVDVYIDLLVLALLAFVFLARDGQESLGARLTLLVIALGSVFLHEAGHAFMARRRGLTVSGIFLHLVPFAYVERGRPADELRVALAGPAVNLVIAAGLFLWPGVGSTFPWLQLDRWLEDPLWTALGINLLMGTLNLLPALPMDGGRALRAGLLMVMAPARAYARTARVGTFVGSAILLVAVVLGSWPESALGAVLGLFVCVVAWREARAGQRERRLERERQRS
jgi:Zn-dependent protease